MGIFLGDGTKATGQISGSKKKMDLWSSIFPKATVKHLKGDCYFLTLPAEERRTLITDNKRIPENYLYASLEQRKQLLKGLIDSDGYIDSRNRVEISFGGDNMDLCDDVLLLLRTMGYKPRVVVDKAMCNGLQYDRKRICFAAGGEQISNRMPERSETGKRFDSYQYFIKDYKLTEKKLMNCIEVEGGVYLIGRELIPTHNSELSSRMLPAFILGRNPQAKIGIASYSSELSNSFNRDVQAYIQSP